MAQFRLWTNKLAEAEAGKAKYQRLADGYGRMLEGLRLLYPNLSDSTPSSEGAAVPTAARAGAGTTIVFAGANVTSIASPREPISSSKAVREVLADLGPDARVTTRDVMAEIARRQIKLDSDNPLTVVRKALAHGVSKGWINSEDRDGRTKVYWLAVQTPGNDPGPAEEAGPEQASDDESPHQGDVITGTFGPSLPMR